MKKNLCFSW